MFQNPSKFTKSSLTTSKGFERWRKHLSFKSGGQVSERFYELNKKCQVVCEKYPIHCGTAVLHLSKLILLNFVKFLDDFLVKDSWEAVYTGKLKFIFISHPCMIKLISIRPSILSIWSFIFNQFDHQFEVNLTSILYQFLWTRY